MYEDILFERAHCGTKTIFLEVILLGITITINVYDNVTINYGRKIKQLTVVDVYTRSFFTLFW